MSCSVLVTVVQVPDNLSCSISLLLYCTDFVSILFLTFSKFEISFDFFAMCSIFNIEYFMNYICYDMFEVAEDLIKALEIAENDGHNVHAHADVGIVIGTRSEDDDDKHDDDKHDDDKHDADTSIEILDEIVSLILHHTDDNSFNSKHDSSNCLLEGHNNSVGNAEDDDEDESESSIVITRMDPLLLKPIKDSEGSDSNFLDGNDVLMMAARNRIRRDKERANSIRNGREILPPVYALSQAQIQMEAAATNNCTRRTCSRKSGVHRAEEVDSAPNENDVEEAEEKEKETREQVVYARFEAFRKDVQVFNILYKRKPTKTETDTETDTDTEASEFQNEFSQFIDRIEATYLQVNPHEDSSSLSVTVFEHEQNNRKVTKLIQGFVTRCRNGKDKEQKLDLNRFCKALFKKTKSNVEAETEADKKKPKILCKFKYWTCKTCGKYDLLFEELKCSVCGRPKRRVLPSPSASILSRSRRKYMSEEEEFLAGAALPSDHNTCTPVLNTNANTGTAGTCTDERLRRQYLYRKTDYDLDVRSSLREEVKQVLNSVRGSIQIDD